MPLILQSSFRAWFAREMLLSRAEGCCKSAPRLPHFTHRALARNRSLDASAPHLIMSERRYRHGRTAQTRHVPTANPKPGCGLAHFLKRSAA
jgi:hypothetical protein